MGIDCFNVIGKNILITGAGSGIGFETVMLLKEYTNQIWAVDRDHDALFKLNSILGVNLITADISLDVDRKRIVKLIDGEIDGLVNCAGIINLLPMRFVTEKQLEEINKNNYLAPVLLTNMLLKKRKISKGASIIFLSSVMSIVSTQTNGMYTASKAAIAAVTKTYALELASMGIRVNAISPGFVKTPMLDFISNFTDLDDAEKKHPLGIGEALDIANSIAFLLSDASKWITGTNLIIDGGYSAK